MAKKLVLKASIRRRGKKSLLIVLTVVLTVLFSLYLGWLMIIKGPSPEVTNLVVSTFMETRRGKAIIQLFFSDEEINNILAQNTITESTEVTDYINDEFVIPEDEKNNIEVIDVSGSTFKGYLMVIRDPSRIELGVNMLMSDYNSNGYFVEDYVNALGGLGGINGGGFADPGGNGDGSIPYGVVIKNGELISGQPSDYGSIIGFNDKNRLFVGLMTGEQALSYGITDAVTFGPALIINYSAQEITGTGGGLNPRTVIGQKEDGSVMLLVIDGRQTTSLGASYNDCINIMMEYGAMNASNLDGGSSSVMYYNGATINSPVSMEGERLVPTAWVVK